MADLRFRAILKPAGLSDAQLRALAEALGKAIDRQKRLAVRTPHVLTLLELTETDQAFIIEHEPATPLNVAEVFDPRSEGWPALRLLRMAAALAEALRVAHDGQSQPMVHGGISPGVILLSPDGVEKVTDFGIAEALSTTLDERTRLDLAVGGDDGAELPGGPFSGVWQRLDPGIERDDRLCAFIDPEKIATATYRSFEPLGDVFAAGVVLHLLAEHRHPYFHHETEAHRVVDMVEFAMPGRLPSAARRKDFRDSEEPAVVAWCELVTAMVQRVPGQRPSAAAVAAKLAEVEIRPADAGEVLRRRMEAVLERATAGDTGDVDWAALREEVGALLEAPDAPADVTSSGAGLTRLIFAREQMDTDEWSRAGEAIAEVLEDEELPRTLRAAAERLHQLLERQRRVNDQLDKAERSLSDGAGKDATTLLPKLEKLEADLEKIFEQELIPAVRQRAETLRNDRLPGARAQVQQEVARIEGEIRDWLELLEEAAGSSEWETADELLHQRPMLPTWMRDEATRIRQVESGLARYRQDQEALQRYRRELQQQLDSARQSLEAADFNNAAETCRQVAGQGDHADLAAEAKDLLERIAERERAHQELEEARKLATQQAIEILAEAQEAAGSDDWATLDQAEELIARVEGLVDADPAQHEQAAQLREYLGKRRDFLLAQATMGIDSLRQAEEDLARAQQILDDGNYLEADTVARIHAGSEVMLIREEAERILAAVDAARQEHRARLREELAGLSALIDAEEFEQALEVARRISRDEHADRELRNEALQLQERAESSRHDAAEARQLAEQRCEQAVEALREGRLDEARTCAGQVLANPRADGPLREEARRLLDVLPGLESAAGLIASNPPGAVAALDALLKSAGPETWGPQREAATKLREEAVRLRRDRWMNGLVEHLEQRADREEAFPLLDSSLPSGSSPNWIQSTIGGLETFIQDCRSFARPVPLRTPVMEAGTRVGEKYEVLEFLGRGGMGEVYKARDLVLDREVALKLARPAEESDELVNALRHEARALAALKHPHIVHINSFDVIGERACFDTNYIRGKDLAGWARAEPHTPRQIAELMIPVCEALAYAHQQGVLHRDIKPQNIYVGAEAGQGPWLIDFGLARMRNICDGRANTGLCGTPGYIAPEVITSMGQDVDPRADIFSLGCVMYELLTGHAAFTDDSASSESQTSGRRGNGAGSRATAASRLPAPPQSGDTFEPTAGPGDSTVRLDDAKIPPGLRDASGPAGSTARMTAAGSKPLVSVSRVLLNTIRGRTTPLSQVSGRIPAELRQICEKAMTPRVEDRYQRVEELAEDLRRFIRNLDQQQARLKVAEAELAMRQRRQKEPAELADLAAARELAAAAVAMGMDDVQAQARKLLDQIETQQRAIGDSAALAATQLQQASDAARGGRWRTVMTMGQTIVNNGYVPELHDQARELLQQARAGLDQSRKRRRAVMLSGVALVVVLAGVGFLVMRGGGGGEPKVPNGRGTVDPAIAAKGGEEPTDVTTTRPIAPTRPDEGTAVANEPPAVLGIKAEQAEGTEEVLTSSDVTFLVDFNEDVGDFDDAGDVVAEVRQGARTTPVPVRIERISGSSYRLHLAMVEGEGKLTLTIPAGVVEDTGGAKNAEAMTITRSFDNLAPVPLVQSPAVAVTRSGPLDYTITYEGASTITLTPAQVELVKEGSAAGTIEVAGEGNTSRIVRVANITGDGSLSIRILAGSAADEHGHSAGAVDAAGSVRVDNTPPRVLTESVTPAGGSTFERAGELTSIQLTASEPAKVSDQPNRVPTVQGTPSTLAVNLRGNSFTLQVPAQIRPGPVEVTIPAGALLDDAGNESPAATWSYTIAMPGWPAAGDVFYGRLAEVVATDLGSPAMGASAVAFTPSSDQSTLAVEVSFPWKGASWAAVGGMSVGPVALPQPWPADETGRRQSAQQAVSLLLADQRKRPEIDAAFRFLSGWQERADLEAGLEGFLGAGGVGPLTGQGPETYLSQIGRIKWAPASVPCPDIRSFASHAARIRDELRTRSGGQLQIPPNRFIEFFWGPTNLYAIYWYADSNTMQCRRLGATAAIGQQVSDLLSGRGGAERALGDSILSPILTDSAGSFLQADGASTSLGVMIAPDGPLCLVPMPRLQFAPVNAGGNVQRAVPPLTPTALSGSVGRLADLGLGDQRLMRTSVGTLVTFGSQPQNLGVPVIRAWEPIWQVMGLQGDNAPAPAPMPQILSSTCVAFCPRGQRQVLINACRTQSTTLTTAGVAAPYDGGFLYARVAPADQSGGVPWFVIVEAPIPTGQ